MKVLHVNKDNFEELVLKNEKTVLVDFWSDRCGPCRMLAPILEDVADECEDVQICKVNVDENFSLAEEYNVMSIPLLIVFKQGSIYKKSVGAIPKEKIIELIS